MASVGGFCAGSREIVDHQRLSGLGYCFSAALPPYLAVASISGLDIMQAESAPALHTALRENAEYLHKAVKNIPGACASQICVCAVSFSGIKHFLWHTIRQHITT